MEEGLEPQEVIERAVEHHHHEHEHGDAAVKHGNATTNSAVTAAVLAVFAAVGSLLSGHAANQAILKQVDASDNWAYYQSKSTKGHIYEVGGEIVRALSGPASVTVTSSLNRFEQQKNRYDKEKEEIQAKAKELQTESQHEFRQHHYYSLGIAAFQVGIVLASISILIRHRAPWWLSLVAGLLGIMFVLRGLILPP